MVKLLILTLILVSLSFVAGITCPPQAAATPLFFRNRSKIMVGKTNQKPMEKPGWRRLILGKELTTTRRLNYPGKRTDNPMRPLHPRCHTTTLRSLWLSRRYTKLLHYYERSTLAHLVIINVRFIFSASGFLRKLIIMDSFQRRPKHSSDNYLRQFTSGSFLFSRPVSVVRNTDRQASRQADGRRRICKRLVIAAAELRR